jgi:hypothetical protein
LFFGHPEAIPVIEQVARSVWEIRKELRSEMFPGSLASIGNSEIIFDPEAPIIGEQVKVIDSWMSTVHWWCVYATHLAGHVVTQIPHGDSAITVRPDDVAFRNRLSWSLLKVDVFKATAAVLDLLLKFYDLPPVNQNRGTPWPPLQEKLLPPRSAEEANLPDRARLAWDSYKYAEHSLTLLSDERLTDDRAYDFLKEHAPEGYELAERDSWKRYVRHARSVLNQSKNRPRAGRTGRSVRKADEF